MVHQEGFEPSTSPSVAGRSKSTELQVRGGSSRHRTCDPRLKRPALCHLSYTPEDLAKRCYVTLISVLRLLRVDTLTAVPAFLR